MADSPFGMTGMPGSNPGGGQQAVPTPASSNTPSIGGGSNPFLPQFPGGAQTPGPTSTINNAQPTDATALLAGGNASSLFGLGAGDPNYMHNLVKALGKAGYSSGVAGQLANFLNSGAGFNPAVAQAMIAAMQPQFQRSQENLLEHFSGMGLRGGSPAAIGLGDLEAQQNLDEGQIFAQLYEDSVKNYMTVLLAGKGNPPQSLFQNINQGLTTLSKFIPGNGGGGSGTSVATPSSFPASPDGETGR